MRALSVFATTLATMSLLLLSAPSAQASDLKVLKPWVSLPLLPDEPAPVYFGMQNNGDKPRKIVGGKSPRAERVEIHRTVFEGGRETSKRIEEWEVPNGGAVSFAQGGVFLVLFGPKDLEEGEKIEIELEFANGENARFKALVRDE